MALMLREMSTRYGRTPGGYIWAILEPLGAIIILSVGFSLILRTPPLGSSFLLFFATGYIGFGLYQGLSQSVSRAINFSRPLLKYPAVTWLDAVLARFLLNSITEVLVAALLLGGIVATLETRVVIDFVPLIEALALAMLLGLGVGVLNCALIGLFPIWEVVWSVATRPLFLASGIFYLYAQMPPFAQDILWYNPLIHIVGLMRAGFYPTYSIAYVDLGFVAGVGLVTLLLGLVLLGRYAQEILNR